MDPNDVPTNTEAELESFRQKWREEVTARSKGKAPAASTKAAAITSSSKPHPSKSHAPDAQSHSHARKLSLEGGDEVSSYTYHDLGEKQHGRRLDETSAQTAAALTPSQEPRSALEHYEKAVEKESQGSLGDSVDLYRKAFKLDSGVQDTYKAKHYPPSYFKKLKAQQAAAAASAPKPQDPNFSNASTTVPNTAHHSLHGLSSSLATLLSEYAQTSIYGEHPPTHLSPAPPCPMSRVPEEILIEILEQLAVQDVSSFVRLSQVCKRLAYLVSTEERVWKRLALGNEYGFGAMHYTWSCGIDGKPLDEDDNNDDNGGIVLGTRNLVLSDHNIEDMDQLASPAEPPPCPATLTQLLVPTPYTTYRTLFRQRPRIRFNGCYISTVNYTRPGQAQPTTSTWNSPIYIVTYFRYLRFLRDGSCISLLTTAEPADVVPYLHVEHLHKNHHNLPTAAMKDAVLGRWRMSGPDIPVAGHPKVDAKLGEAQDTDKEGTMHIETPGATPKYLYKMALTFGNAGRSTKNNKLVWQGYWSYNRLTDDWGEFGLKNDRAFYFSRVRSYGMGWGEKGIKA